MDLAFIAGIDAAIRHNQMQAIDRWVIGTVFGHCVTQTPLRRQPVLPINLSGQSLRDRQFLSGPAGLLAVVNA